MSNTTFCCGSANESTLLSVKNGHSSKMVLKSVASSAYTLLTNGTFSYGRPTHWDENAKVIEANTQVSATLYWILWLLNIFTKYMCNISSMKKWIWMHAKQLQQKAKETLNRSSNKMPKIFCSWNIIPQKQHKTEKEKKTTTAQPEPTSAPLPWPGARGPGASVCQLQGERRMEQDISQPADPETWGNKYINPNGWEGVCVDGMTAVSLGTDTGLTGVRGVGSSEWRLPVVDSGLTTWWEMRSESSDHETVLFVCVCVCVCLLLRAVFFIWLDCSI